MGELARVLAQEEGQPQYYINIPSEELGDAAPPLYDDFRALFESISAVARGEGRERRVTERIRNCAARLLTYINYRLSKVDHPEAGFQFSRTQFHTKLRSEYSLDIIEVAQDLLILSGFVYPPEQENTFKRGFFWKINGPVLREALIQVRKGAKQKASSSRRTIRQKRTQLALVHSTESDAAPRQTEEPTAETAARSHAQNSDHASREMPSMNREFADEDVQEGSHACEDNGLCNKNGKEGVQNNGDIHQPSHREQEGSSLHKEDVSAPETRAHLRILKPEYPLPDLSLTLEERCLAIFDYYRGYLLRDRQKKRAKEAAKQLIYGNEEQQQRTYTLFEIEQTFLYVRDYDPAWKANYEHWCGTTGIPEIWSIAKVIGAKWPLARRLLLEREYIEVDGEFVRSEEYQAMLERDYENQRVAEQAQQEDTLVKQDPSNGVEETSEATVTQEANPLGAEPEINDERDTHPSGWLHSSLTLAFHLKRLDQVLPPEYRIEVQPMQDDDERVGIVVTNIHNEEDCIYLTSNADVCQLMNWARSQREIDDDRPGWTNEDIVSTQAKFTRILPPYFYVRPVVLSEDCFGLEVRNLCVKDDILVITSEQQGNAALIQIRKEVVAATLSSGWSIQAIAQWWIEKKLTHVLPSAYQVRIWPLEDRVGIAVLKADDPEPEKILVRNCDVERFLADLQQSEHEEVLLY